MDIVNRIRYILVILLIGLHQMAAHGQDPGDLLWNATTDWHVTSIAPTGDIDGNGFADIFVGSEDSRIYCYSGGGTNKGDIIWSWFFEETVWTTASIPDMNGDGVADCLVGTSGHRVYCMSGKPILGLTEILWSFPTYADVWCVAVIGDLNDDGIMECLVGTAHDSVHCLNGAYGNRLWSFPTISDIRSIHAIPDVNGDGKEDCLAGGNGDRILCISGGSSGTGTLLWQYTTGSTVLSVAPIEDVNSDGVADCIAAGEDDYVYCISGNSIGSATRLWRFKSASTVRSVHPIADVNDDGVDDCLAGGEDDYVYCLSGLNGSVLWSNKMSSTVTDVASIPDVNGDGVEDCIAGSENSEVFCISGNSSGTGALYWSKTIGGSVNCIASIEDISGNGLFDIIAGSDDSYIYAYEGGSISESVSAPQTPNGPSSGTVGEDLAFTTGGSTSDLGHDVEYRFDWGDGNQSDWGSSGANHNWPISGSYMVKAQARCTSHTWVESDWSAALTVLINPVETVSVPSVPSGPSSGTIGEDLAFTTGGSVSNLGHDVQYRFDWGDGNQSDWGASGASYTWSAAGSFDVRAQARCAAHTSVVSGWSSPLTVHLTQTGIEWTGESGLPTEFQLFQNHPNPFNSQTVILFHLPKNSDINLSIYSSSGHWITTLTTGNYPAGKYRFEWDGRNASGLSIPSGVYIYKLKTNHHSSVRTMMYIK